MFEFDQRNVKVLLGPFVTRMRDEPLDLDVLSEGIVFRGSEVGIAKPDYVRRNSTKRIKFVAIYSEITTKSSTCSRFVHNGLP